MMLVTIKLILLSLAYLSQLIWLIVSQRSLYSFPALAQLTQYQLYKMKFPPRFFRGCALGRNVLELHYLGSTMWAPLGCVLDQSCAILLENCTSTKANEEKVIYEYSNLTKSCTAIGAGQEHVYIIHTSRYTKWLIILTATYISLSP